MTPPTTAAGLLAWRTLAALGVLDSAHRAEARQIIAQWCRPSPKLSVAEICDLMSSLDEGTDDYPRDNTMSGEMPVRGTLRDNLD